MGHSPGYFRFSSRLATSADMLRALAISAIIVAGAAASGCTNSGAGEPDGGPASEPQQARPRGSG